ncbi:MAG: cysteine desulfurase family protein [Candidatus Bruticola sp.]
MIYLDNAATTAVLPEVVEAMLPFFTKFYGNPSNIYGLSLASRRALDAARASMAKSLGAKLPAEIFFTGCGTESDNLAVIGLARARRELGNHIITTTVEHHAVLHACEQLKKEGFEITKISVDSNGLLDVDKVAAALTDKTILVSVMMANNEVGTIQPIAELGRLLANHQAYLHTDAVQAAGYIPINVDELGVDALSVSAHKFHGPKGVGALYLRTGVRPLSVNYGGGQERGLRSGTENVPGIIGMAKALEMACSDQEKRAESLRAKRDYLIEKILSSVRGAELTGHPALRLPGNASFVFPGVEGESLIMQLDRKGVCASSGSACASSALGISHVLEAMGYHAPLGRGSLRLTLNDAITYAELDEAADIIIKAALKLQAMAPKSCFTKTHSCSR